jgi:hypothetical protein
VPQKVDLNDLLSTRATISIDPEETVEERAARLKQEGREHTVELVKGCVVFGVIVLAMIFIGGLCAYESVFDPTASPDTKRWAQTTLSVLFAGGVSFVVGRLTVSKTK